MTVFQQYLFGFLVALALGLQVFSTYHLAQRVEAIESVAIERIAALEAQAADTESFKILCVNYVNGLAGRLNEVINALNTLNGGRTDESYIPAEGPVDGFKATD